MFLMNTKEGYTPSLIKWSVSAITDEMAFIKPLKIGNAVTMRMPRPERAHGNAQHVIIQFREDERHEIVIRIDTMRKHVVEMCAVAQSHSPVFARHVNVNLTHNPPLTVLDNKNVESSRESNPDTPHQWLPFFCARSLISRIEIDLKHCAAPLT